MPPSIGISMDIVEDMIFTLFNRNIHGLLDTNFAVIQQNNQQQIQRFLSFLMVGRGFPISISQRLKKILHSDWRKSIWY